MAKCFICNKGSLKGYKVSHSDVKTRKFFKPNLHSLTVKTNEQKEVKIRMCSKCYKRLKKDFWEGEKLPFVPLSLLNQARIKNVKVNEANVIVKE
jgi:large subunit ribosomal protein L28